MLLDYTYDSRRQRPLEIIGPPGLEERVYTLYQTLYSERRGETLPFPVRFTEMRGHVRVRGPPTPGSRASTSRIRRRNSHSAIASPPAERPSSTRADTPWTDDLIKQSSGADLFLCECSAFDSEVPRHVRYVELEQNLQRLECKDLMLIHLGSEVRKRSSEIDLTLADDGVKKTVG